MQLGNVYGPYRIKTGIWHIGIKLFNNSNDHVEHITIPYSKYIKEYQLGLHRYLPIKELTQSYLANVNCVICGTLCNKSIYRRNYFKTTCSVSCENRFYVYRKNLRQYVVHEDGILCYIRQGIFDKTATHILNYSRKEKRITLYPITDIRITMWSDENGITRTSIECNEKNTHRIKSVVGFKKHYWVTDTGLIVSKRNRSLLQIFENSGYYKANLCDSDNRFLHTVHRAVAEAFIPNPQNKPFVNHIDGVKLNNLQTNLEWCTSMENTHHAIRIGLMNNNGENNAEAKLTNEQVRWMRNDFKLENKPYEFYSKIFSVSTTTIGYAIRGDTFTNV